MEKINIAKLLKDCPYGMELYSPLCGDCKLYDVNDYSIRIETPNKDTLISLYHDGRYCNGGEIMIFPKGKTTWKGFVPPCKFKDGDIIYVKDKHNNWCSIFNKCENEKLYTYVDFCFNSNRIYCYNPTILCDCNDITEQRFATEEERQKLFDGIKAKGYKWNTETKTLKKLSKSYEEETTNKAIFDCNAQCCDIMNDLIKEETKNKPEFKVGDKIRHKINIKQINVITEIKDTHYILDGELGLPFISQDKYELVPDTYELAPDKFDINTLKPFDKVLVRDNNAHKWTIDFFGFINEYKKLPFVCVRDCVTQCIPYEGNEHLLGTNNECNEYYKTWK